MTRLIIVHGSTRPARKGIHVSREFEKLAQARGFDVDFADLQEVNLPFFNEENVPRMGQYEFEHTKQWAQRVDSADAIVWATSEYNGAFPAPLKNAIDYLFAEWQNKPLGIIGWGAGPGGGSRAIGMLETVATNMGLDLTGSPVPFASLFDHLNDDGSLRVSDEWTSAANNLLDSLKQAVAVQSH